MTVVIVLLALCNDHQITGMIVFPIMAVGIVLCFCFWAFRKTSIRSIADANLMGAERDDPRLALEVVGSSLHKETYEVWESVENSTDSLDHVSKESFLDLASLPEGTKICVHVRRLSNLASRNLVDLTSTQGLAISYGNASELYSEHNAMRRLALHLGCQDCVFHKKRLVMLWKEQNLSQKLELLNHGAHDVQLLSIHTGPMKENQWGDMIFPDTEALILLFTGTEYYLPPFLKSMKKLKFLMVSNCGRNKATVKGLDILSSLTQLRSLCLDRLIATPVQEESKFLPNLETLHLCSCEGFEDTSTFKSLKMRDFNLDHSSNLEKVPVSLCYMHSAQIWSITNCHLIQKLPPDLGNLTSLRMLRLSGLQGLKALPSSIGNLKRLECLDISLCVGLRELPEDIDQLKKLITFDMRGCSCLMMLPRGVDKLSSLELVICGHKIGKQWLRAKISIPDLSVKISPVQGS
ncbi:hypothetical protein SUGI_0362740 [Cryptomeria japonica]|nr:hypothetical protein SUGI_0362740 [Cryptomeria japonica]